MRIVIDVPDEFDGIKELLDVYKTFAYATLIMGIKDPYVTLRREKKISNPKTNLIPNEKAMKDLRILNQCCHELAEYMLDMNVR